MPRRAFTVVELLVAVVVLLVVIIATSKIFNTASKVSSTGEANADVLQQATVVEEQMRRDLERICRDGYLAIQCVAVRNDVNKVISGELAPLVNPQLDRGAVIRCDQLVFFTAGTETSARWAGPGDLVAIGGGQQARATRVYYGHGVQFPDLPNDPTSNPPGSNPNSPVKPIITGVTPPPSGVPRQVTPWTWFNPLNHQLGWRYGASNQSAGPRILANQPEARQWVLARKAVLLADDGGRSTFYPEPTDLVSPSFQAQGPTSATSIFGDRSYTSPSGTDAVSQYQELRDRNRVVLSTNLIPSPSIQSGWIDIAASDLDKVRRMIAPTLRLSLPVNLAGRSYLTSISVPWTAPGIGQPPYSWPTGPEAPSWPSGTAVDPEGWNGDSGAVGGFSTQRDRIMRGTFGIPAASAIPPTGTAYGLLGWPRSEKSVSNTDRKSEMLASPTLLTNCSSFQVDWTWEPLTGRQTDSSGAVLVVADRLSIRGAPDYRVKVDNETVLRGFEPFADSWPLSAGDPFQVPGPQPWFGLPGGEGGVTLAQDKVTMPDVARGPDLPQNMTRTNLHMRTVARAIEGIDQAGLNQPGAITSPFGASVPVRVYTAVFGFNQDEAFTVTPDGIRVMRDDYTPWPTQLRITCTIHDSRLVLDRGRVVQFVLDVPKRRKD